MDMLIGRVISIPVVKDGTCTFEVQSKWKKYSVISKDYQAVRDNIFVNVGQSIEMLGDIIEDTIYIKKSRIVLRKENM
ncbi:MAG: hypothetical protein IKL73_08430 [Lachnospiraceae bacterium]|nr:hypothetical protein [Lachnospiraceae bacterium]